jgi:hypothetical protein
VFAGLSENLQSPTNAQIFDTRISAMFSKFTSTARKFHNDEEGLEALQVVMIIAIAAMVMIACAAIGKAANKFMGTHANTLINNTDLTAPEGFTAK